MDEGWMDGWMIVLTCVISELGSIGSSLPAVTS